MRVYYLSKDVRNVTGFYYQIIIDALKAKGVESISLNGELSFSRARNFKREDYALITDPRDFFKLYFWGHRKFIYWYQGVMPEEILMISGSKMRYRMFSFMERLSLKRIRYKIGVSSYLFHHFENKYDITIPSNSIFIMPCFNNELNKESFYINNKYNDNIFCYAGSVEVWQGFEEMVKIYCRIEKKNPHTFFRIYSKDLEKARSVVDKYDIKNYSIESLPPEKVDAALATCKFGFIIREDNIVNNVATPTKFCTYIGNGVIPIFTPAIKTFADISNDNIFLCCSTLDNMEESINKYINMEIDPSQVFEEFSGLYNRLFNREYYVNRLISFFDNI